MPPPNMNRERMADTEGVAINGNLGWTLRPHSTDEVQPTLDPFTELSWPGVFDAPKLIRQSEGPKERNTLFTLGSEASIGQPGEHFTGTELRSATTTLPRIADYTSKWIIRMGDHSRTS